MGRELGRISGPLLTDNLLRNGTDLAFDTTLMYLNVTNKYVGINNNTPIRELTVNGTTLTDNLIVDTSAELGNFVFGDIPNGSQIQDFIGTIYISPNQSSLPAIVVPQLNTADLNFTSNTITSDTDIVLNPSGKLTINSNALVNGNLHSTGNITFDGNIDLGNQSSDLINLVGEITSNIIPSSLTAIEVPNNPGFDTFTYLNYFYATRESIEQYRIQVGAVITDSKFAPGTTITQLNGPLQAFGLDYYVVYTSINQTTNVLHNEVVLLTAIGNTLGSVTNPWKNIYTVNVSPVNLSVNSAIVSNAIAGNITFNGNNIRDQIADITVSVSGSGQINFNNSIYFQANTITSNSLIFQNTGQGYNKFAGTSGVVLPVGDSSTRTNSPVLGMTRFNNVLGYTEIWNGTNWQNIAGVGGLLNQSQTADIMNLWGIILG